MLALRDDSRYRICRRRRIASGRSPVEALPSPAGDASSAPQLTTAGDRAIVQLDGACRAACFEVRRAHGNRDGRAARRVASGSDLRRQRGGRAVGSRARRRHAGGRLDAGETVPTPRRMTCAWRGRKTAARPGRSRSIPHHDRHRDAARLRVAFPGAGRGPGLVWLDGRADELEAREADRQHEPARHGLQPSRACSRARSAIDTRVCDCCPTSRRRRRAEGTDRGVPQTAATRRSATSPCRALAARTLDRAGHGAQRRLGRSKRARSTGPPISARGRDVAVAWFTALKDEGQSVRRVLRTTRAAPSAHPSRVDEVSAIGHVGVELLKDGAAAVSWIEFAERAAAVQRSGAWTPTATLTAARRPSRARRRARRRAPAAHPRTAAGCCSRGLKRRGGAATCARARASCAISRAICNRRNRRQRPKLGRCGPHRSASALQPQPAVRGAGRRAECVRHAGAAPHLHLRDCRTGAAHDGAEPPIRLTKRRHRRERRRARQLTAARPARRASRDRGRQEAPDQQRAARRAVSGRGMSTGPRAADIRASPRDAGRRPPRRAR